MRELLGRFMNPELVSAELVSLLTDGSRRAKLERDLKALRERVIGNGESPSLRAAREVLALRDELLVRQAREGRSRANSGDRA